MTARGDAALADVQVHARLGAGPTRGDELLNSTFSLRGAKADVPADAAGGARPKFRSPKRCWPTSVQWSSPSRAASTYRTRHARSMRAGRLPPRRRANLRAGRASLGAGAQRQAAALRAQRGRHPHRQRQGRFQRPLHPAELQRRAVRAEWRHRLPIPFARWRRSACAASEGATQLEISGALNPTARPLALDIKAKATDLELAPLSPYSGRYAGYAIERGKLGDVAYKIDPDGKLDARNQIVLNQLTFGDKVDSPTPPSCRCGWRWRC